MKDCCLTTYTHPHTHTHTYIYIYIYVDDYRDIYSPALVGLSSQANEVIVLPLAFIASLFIHMH